MMPPPFNRWDSARYACGLSGILGVLAADTAWQWFGYGLRGVGLSAAAAVGAAWLAS